MLETSDLSLTDTSFLQSIEDLMFVERIERAFRQLFRILRENIIRARFPKRTFSGSRVTRWLKRRAPNRGHLCKS